MEGTGQTSERIGERCARTGDIEALEPIPGRAEDGTVVQPEPGFVHNAAGQLVMGEPVGTEIHPEQIGPFRFHQAGVRQMGGEMVPEEIAVRGNIGLDFSKPGFPLFVRRF